MQLPKGIQNAEIYIKPPSGAHKGFAIVARWQRGTPNQRTETLKLPEITATNKALKSGKISHEHAYQAFVHLVERLTEGRSAKKAPKYSPANKKILDRYFSKVYGPRDIKTPRNAYARLLRIINLLGPLPLATASDLEFYKVIKEASDDPITRKRLMSSLNQLLKFIGRTDFQVLRTKNVRRKIRYLTLDELKAVTSGIVDENFSLLCWAMFATGCRPGEMFALGSQSYSPSQNAVFVEGSIDRDTLEETSTKTGEARHTAVVKECLPTLLRWLSLPKAERLKLRGQRHGEMFARAVSQVFPDKGKMVLYDLRHSYAIWWLNRGASTKLVAQALGNSQTVCEMHYQGHYLTQGGIDTMNRLQDNA